MKTLYNDMLEGLKMDKYRANQIKYILDDFPYVWHHQKTFDLKINRLFDKIDLFMTFYKNDIQLSTIIFRSIIC